MGKNKRWILILFILVFIIIIASFLFYENLKNSDSDAYLIKEDFRYFKFYDSVGKAFNCSLSGAENCKLYEAYYELVPNHDVRMRVLIGISEGPNLKIIDILKQKGGSEDVSCSARMPGENKVICRKDYKNSKDSTLLTYFSWVSNKTYIEISLTTSSGLEPYFIDVLEAYVNKYPSTVF